MTVGKDAMQAFIVSWGMVLIALALYYHTSRVQGFQGSSGPAAGNPVVRRPIAAVEAFEDMEDPTGEFRPAEAAVEDARKPYALLDGVLAPGEPGRFVSPNAKDCYDADFQKRLEMTGNYRQLTNNYKRAVPDSCSAPTHELVLNFYKTDPLPFSGCLNK